MTLPPALDWNGKPIDTCKSARIEVDGQIYNFLTEERIPATPLRYTYTARGAWGAKQRFTIDANLQCWTQVGYNGEICSWLLEPVDHDEFFSALREHGAGPEQYFLVRSCLGIPNQEPEWAALARAAGWKSPKGWAW